MLDQGEPVILRADTAADADIGGEIAIAHDWLHSFGAIALATVIKTWGAAPVPVGGHLVIGPGERFEGSVSGGCVEAEVIARASEVMETGLSQVLDFGIADETAWGVGLACGGRIEVLVERLEKARDIAMLEEVLRRRSRREWVVLRVNVQHGGRHLVHDLSELPSELRQALNRGESQLIGAHGSRVFFQAYAPPVQVLLVGAGHIAQVLADLARRVGLSITVIDPRTAFATRERFKGVRIIHEWPRDALRNAGLDARTAVVTLAHAPAIDDEALTEALSAPCFYIGALGSRRSHEKRLVRLRAGGITESQLQRIDGPVGVPIGAKGADEIAVSILAAIIKAKRVHAPIS